MKPHERVTLAVPVSGLIAGTAGTVVEVWKGGEGIEVEFGDGLCLTLKPSQLVRSRTILAEIVHRADGRGGPRFCSVARSYRGRWITTYEHGPRQYVTARQKAAMFLAAAARYRRMGGLPQALAITSAQCLAVARAWIERARQEQPLP